MSIKTDIQLKTDIDTTLSKYDNRFLYSTFNKDNLKDIIDSKQALLVSSTNIKTINGTSILGSGDITTPTTNSGVAGRLSLYPSTGTTLDDQYIQNSNLIDVKIDTHPTLSSSRTYSLKDVGSSANFLMDNGENLLLGKIYLVGNGGGIFTNGSYSNGLFIGGPSSTVLGLRNGYQFTEAGSIGDTYAGGYSNILKVDSSGFNYYNNTGSNTINVSISNTNLNFSASGTFNYLFKTNNGNFIVYSDVVGTKTFEVSMPSSGNKFITSYAQTPFRFYNAGNTFYTSLKAGSNTANLDLTLPITDGTSGQVITTNGSGVLTFTTVSGGSGVASLSTIGSTPNANGGTITGTILNFQPANELFGGVITTTTQKLAGTKTLVANGANATSTATQKDSFKFAFESSLWNGSVESKNTFEIYSKTSTTVNSSSFITTSYNGTDLFRIDNTGSIWSLPNFATTNTFSIVCEATDKKLLSIDSVEGRIVIGYDTLSPTPDTTNIDYIVIGNKTFNTIYNGGALENFDKSIVIGNNIRNGILNQPQYMPNNSIVLGHDIDLGASIYSVNSVTNSIIIGNTNIVKSNYSNYILLANNGTNSSSNTFQAGSRTSRMTDVYFGGGKYDTNVYSISGCNAVDVSTVGFSTQTDTVGGSLILKGGWSTGTGIGGALDIDSYYQTNSTGTTANTTQANIIRVQNNNIALFGKNTNYEYGSGKEVMFFNSASTNPTTNPTNGAIFYVDNTGKLPKYRDISGFTITL